MAESESNGQRGFVVKNWSVVLTLIAWLVISVVQYATLSAQAAQNARDIEAVKRESVTRERFDELKEDILRRLQRIEDKLDRDRALKKLE